MSVRLLTLDDVAENIGCHKRTVSNWLAKNEGPAVRRLGHFVRVREDDYQAWLDQRRAQSAPANAAAET